MLMGPGICVNHATILNRDDMYLLNASSKAASATFINGESLASLKQRYDGCESGVVLRHADYVTFGKSIFVFVDPQVDWVKG